MSRKLGRSLASLLFEPCSAKPNQCHLKAQSGSDSGAGRQAVPHSAARETGDIVCVKRHLIFSTRHITVATASLLDSLSNPCRRGGHADIEMHARLICGSRCAAAG